MKYISILVLTFLMVSCKNEKKEVEKKMLTATEIINKSIEISGGNIFENSIIHFDFRDKHYSAQRKNGQFEFTRRSVENQNDSIRDILNNAGFVRKINGVFTNVVDSMATKYAASVNSVHYFSVLPYGLNNDAVNKRLLGDEKIKSKDYYKIKVTFSQDGGGEDYEDIFVYWLDKESFKVEYLAYSYKEEDGIGMRFREAYNERYIDGLRFVDYNNFKAQVSEVALEDLGKAFDNNQLKLLSKIELKTIKVDLIEN